MRVRLKFQKYGPMKFIGHLDVLRYFQKAFRRAGIDSEYTTGFNPHQIISFAAPLGLGLTSDSEYVDIGLNSSEAPEIMINKINEFMSEGFYVTGFQMLEEPADNEKKVSAMSLVSSADYLVSLKDGYCLSLDINNIEKFNEVFSRFYDRTEITINKKTKKSSMLVNIKPMIRLVSFDESDYKNKLKELLLDLPTDKNNQSSYFIDAESKAEIYDNNIKIYMQLATGSVANLKPELVIEAFCNDNNIEYNPYAWQVHRLELYTHKDSMDKLIPLSRFNK